jgi:hypothetical protein
MIFYYYLFVNIIFGACQKIAIGILACEKPSGGFSHNPAEGYRIPYPTKNHLKPLHPKERT